MAMIFRKKTAVFFGAAVLSVFLFLGEAAATHDPGFGITLIGISGCSGLAGPGDALNPLSTSPDGKFNMGSPSGFSDVSSPKMDTSMMMSEESSLLGISCAWGSEIYGQYAGFGANPRQGMQGEIVRLKNGQGSDIRRRPFIPELGSFFLLGCGLLMLAGWGKRRFRR